MAPIYNFAKPAFNEVIPAPKSPINNAGSTPCGGLPRLVRPPCDRLDYCYRWFLVRFNTFMRSIARFRAVIPWSCSRFFFFRLPLVLPLCPSPAAPFFLLIFFYFYLYIIIMFYYLHRSFSSPFTFLFLFLFIFLGFIWRGGRLIYIWGGLPGQKGQWTQWI